MKLGLKRDEIRLVDYTSEWNNEFNRVKSQIMHNVKIDANRIEHIGSTAIKNMSAKPIIDMLVGVDDLSNVDGGIFEGFKNIGFLRLKVRRPNEIVLAKFTDDSYEIKTHYIHLVEYQKDAWNNLIFFRDYLNSNEHNRIAYLKIKLEYLKKSSTGIKDYTDYKEEFVKSIFKKRNS